MALGDLDFALEQKVRVTFVGSVLDTCRVRPIRQVPNSAPIVCPAAVANLACLHAHKFVLACNHHWLNINVMTYYLYSIPLRAYCNIVFIYM